MFTIREARGADVGVDGAARQRGCARPTRPIGTSVSMSRTRNASRTRSLLLCRFLPLRRVGLLAGGRLFGGAFLRAAALALGAGGGAGRLRRVVGIGVVTHLLD